MDPHGNFGLPFKNFLLLVLCLAETTRLVKYESSCVNNKMKHRYKLMPLDPFLSLKI